MHGRVKGISLANRHKAYDVVVRHDGAFELYVEQCLRKRREVGEREPQYVWTNVELEWEEHHYIEARYFASTEHVRVTVNGELSYEGELPEIKPPDWLR